MSVEEAVEQALARAMEWTNEIPATRSLYYRRLGVRQQQLFGFAAAIDPDYYGICAVGVLDEHGRVNLRSLAEPVPAADAVSRIQIKDPGTSSYAAGRRVNIVRLDDAHSAEPPRVRIRDRVVEGVGTDLEGVVSLHVFYPRRPAAVAPDEGSREIELPEPFDELLVIDLARYAVRKTFEMEPEVRAASLKVLAQEEGELLAAFEAHVRGYPAGLESRPE